MWLFLLMLAVPAVLISCSKDDDDDGKREISPEELHADAVQFINDAFPGLGIARATVDNDEYEVTLNTGFVIDFNLQGQWTKVDCFDVGIAPDTGIVPDGIRTDLATRHPEAIVTMIEKEQGGGYEIRVRGGTISGSRELIYNSELQFVRYDD